MPAAGATQALRIAEESYSAILPLVGLQSNGSGTSPLLSAALPTVAQQTTRDIVNQIIATPSESHNLTDHIPEPL